MKLFLAGLLALAALTTPAAPASGAVTLGELRTDSGQESASDDTRGLADWVAASGDNAGQPFVIVDKRAARVFVFGTDAQLLGTAPALLGLALGDVSVPGIGDRKLSTIRPAERTTPAGRFEASLAKSAAGDEILWVDYDSAVALHRVIATVPAERRLQRLSSRQASDRRITYGCINVPVEFFESVVLPAFRGSSGIVYVLPETSSPHTVPGFHGRPAGIDDKALR